MPVETKKNQHNSRQSENSSYSRLDTSPGPTRSLAVLAPSDDPPTKNAPRTVQRFRDRLLCARPYAQGVLRRKLNAPRELPARKGARRVAKEDGVVHARRAPRQRQR